MSYLYYISFLAVFCLVCLLWFIRNNLKTRPKATIIVTMAILIFFITGATILKTYSDYKTYISDIQGVLVSNITFAVFLDFSVLLIGGLFLYLANQVYVADEFETKKIAEAKKKAAEIRNSVRGPRPGSD